VQFFASQHTIYSLDKKTSVSRKHRMAVINMT